ncbi:MAG: hypothetical protein A3F41_01705 [Coxiella sp. RIFCSPHIGHO2_12_FULL_44_14]|nr:MAG: hypothetical protein A3F41_01705 [Coxiella sp. RIFCSPHIGHO2_12_FULL_44_14]
MRGYISILAHQVTKQRKQQSGRRIKLKSLAIQQFVQRWLPLGWTPEIIASQIPHYFPGRSLSPEAIYQYIYSDW